MNKKLICLILSLVMLLSVCLTGCGSNDEEGPVTTLTTRTLSMFVISDKTIYDTAVLNIVEQYLTSPESCDAATKTGVQNWIKSNVPAGEDAATFVAAQKKISEQYDAVEKQINILTKKQYSIQLNIQYINKDIYYEYVKQCLETPNSGYTGVIEESIAVENELGVPEYVYPEIPDTHVDILYIGDTAYFNEFVEEELLSSLTSEINGTYKTLKTEIYPAYLSALTVNGDLYGIPNNAPAGEYTYLLLNKALADKYSFPVSEMDTWAECEKFLELAASELDAPILLPDGISESSYTEDQIFANFLINNHYWSVEYDGSKYSVDSAKFSLLGFSYNKDATQSGNSTTKYLFDNTLASSINQSQLAALLSYMEKDYFKNVSEGETFGVGVFTGTPVEAKQYQDDYYMVTIDVPHLRDSEACKSMLAVGAKTTSVSKAAQIISFIDTNPEVRNLLQYGIEGENYILDENNRVVTLEGNAYKMDVMTTGNILKAYAPDNTYATYDAEGNVEDEWGLVRLQASETLIHPLYRFDINEAIKECDYKIDTVSLKSLNELSEEYYEKLLEIDRTLSIEEIVEQIKAYGRELNTNKLMIKMRSMNYSTNNSEDVEATGTSVAEAYYWWLFNNGLASAISSGTEQ